MSHKKLSKHESFSSSCYSDPYKFCLNIKARPAAA